MRSTPGRENVLVGTLSHNALCAGTLHPTELSINGAKLCVIIFMNTIPLPHSMMPLLIVRTKGLIITFTTLGPKNATRSYRLILLFT